jgi:arylsulfatase A-like enzyme
LLLTSILLSIALTGFAAQKPNIVLILADDLGYADVGVQGAKHRTPIIDQMAAEGMRLTSFYTAANVCTPTRASLMTGCYAKRVGLHENQDRNWVLLPGDSHGLSANEITLPQLLKKQGYATVCLGKWHLGDQPEFLPTRHGFDEYFGIPFSNDMGRTERTDNHFPPLPMLRGEKVIETEPDQHFLTRRYTDEAVAFLKRNRDHPFFMYFAHNMPHWPQFASEAFAGKSGNGRYGDAVTEIDWSVGVLLQTLRDLKLEDNTLVLFLSDNGGPIRQGANNLPLRAGKGTIFEGGHRVPFIARWPGKVPAGKTTPEIAVTFDLYTTLAKLGGAKIPTDRTVDGRDIWPLITGEAGAKSPHEAFYYYHHDTLGAVRSGPWKLITAHTEAPQGQPDQRHPVAEALYNLDSDISEKQDVLAPNPEVANRLRSLATKMRADLGDGPPGPGCRAAGIVKNPKTLTQAFQYKLDSWTPGTLVANSHADE